MYNFFIWLAAHKCAVSAFRKQLMTCTNGQCIFFSRKCFSLVHFFKVRQLTSCSSRLKKYLAFHIAFSVCCRGSFDFFKYFFMIHHFVIKNLNNIDVLGKVLQLWLVASHNQKKNRSTTLVVRRIIEINKNLNYFRAILNTTCAMFAVTVAYSVFHTELYSKFYYSSFLAVKKDILSIIQRRKIHPYSGTNQIVGALRLDNCVLAANY